MLQPISDDEIRFVESVLLPQGATFDAEREAFIKQLNSCDLQAVPGSGKTTVLLAKLLILERRLPLSSGKGLLILSHTNTAVDEVKSKLKPYCTKLFSYPNFIGTIQAFVDEFLAIPYYIKQYEHKPVRIDNEIYFEKVAKSALDYTTRTWVNRRVDPQDFLNSIRLNADDALISTIKGTVAEFPLRDTNSATYRGLLSFKKNLLTRGYLCFDDAYYLANKYIATYPRIINLLRSRFHCVFVDEMQDMEAHQFELLESIFNYAEVSYQRIGDRNQAIFSGASSEETRWTDRHPVMRLNGSQRLSANIARITQPFGVYADNPIEGRNTSQLKPHILVFTPDRARSVLPCFGGLVERYIADGSISPELKYPIKAVGWVGKPSVGGNVLYLPDYYEPYDRATKAIKIDHHNLLSYLVFIDKKASTLHSIKASILNSILRILREEGILTKGRDFNKKQLLHELKIERLDLHDELNTHLYQWAMGLVKGQTNEVHALIQAYVPDFLRKWKDVANLTEPSQSFLSSTDVGEQAGAQDFPTNVYKHGNLEIEVATLHSVKGQTHTATLYMETKFHNYESEKCIDYLLGQSALNIAAPRKRAAAKVMYVGLSRPTDLLCFAALSDRITEHLPALEEKGWQIVQVN